LACSGTKLIACLGNPGLRYSITWHNAGFWVADVLASEAGVSFTAAGLFEAAALRDNLDLIKPSTFMNRSGIAVREFLGLRGYSCDELLVVCDDVNLPLGTLRLRAGGSHGGHNGLRNIIERLETEDFSRLRLGVGPPPGTGDLADYVLERIPGSLEDEASLMAHRAADCVLRFVSEGLEAAQAVYNRKPPE
jgi:PTH1 family peptidyl-tRNA hydrolase